MARVTRDWRTGISRLPLRLAFFTLPMAVEELCTSMFDSIRTLRTNNGRSQDA
jgi:hypothetical protein